MVDRALPEPGNIRVSACSAAPPPLQGATSPSTACRAPSLGGLLHRHSAHHRRHRWRSSMLRCCSRPLADTNAAIVGGVLGALHGASGIPADMRQQVEAYRWDRTQGPGSCCVRPQRLCGSQLAPLAQRLYEEAVRDAAELAAQQECAAAAP